MIGSDDKMIGVAADIISDAMRYEVGQELFARMQDDPKCTAKLSVQLSVLKLSALSSWS